MGDYDISNEEKMILYEKLVKKQHKALESIQEILNAVG